MDLFWVFAGLSILGLVSYGLQIKAVRAHLATDDAERLREKKGTGYEQSNADVTRSGFLPPVSILKPLKGLDDNLYDNLESFCRQDYPEYEIIFSLQDDNDPAYKVAEKIRSKHRDRDISVVVEPCEYALNPKINNLIPAYRKAKYQYILISDSNVLVDAGYLRSLMTHMADPGVALVSNLIRGVGGHSLGSILENLHLNSFVIGSVCFMDRFCRMPCVVGKSMLMRRSDFEEVGGFDAVQDVLAEDFILGRLMGNCRKRVIISGRLINNVNVHWSLKKFLNRHTRWGKLRWKIGGIRYLAELFGNSVFMSAFPLFLWEPSKTTMSFVLLVSLLKCIGDYRLGTRIGAGHKKMHYLLVPVKDILIGLIWFVSLLNSSVSWRGNRYKITRGSVLVPVQPFALNVSADLTEQETSAFETVEAL